MSLTLIIAGILLLGYVGGEYWGMYRSQKNLEAAWQNQAATLNASSQTHQLNIAPEQMLTRLVVTKIGIDAIVVEGASRKDLSEGPGHMKQTAEPGETGNAVVTGHRDTFFLPLRNIRREDVITMTTLLGEYRYRVVSTKIVAPEDAKAFLTDPLAANGFDHTEPGSGDDVAARPAAAAAACDRPVRP